MKPMTNIVYQIQYVTISLIWDLQENIYNKVKKTYTGRHVVGFRDLGLDVFLEVQNQRYN